MAGPLGQAQPEMAAAPQVEKMDPPNWWVGFAPEVMLLMKGHNLSGAGVTTSYSGVRVARSEASANGDYLFVWLKIAAKARAGRAAFTIRNGSGGTTVRFPLLRPAPAAGRFQGVTPDDTIYLIMPDRFADGDPGNDRTAGSTAVYDRHDPMAYHGGDLRGVIEHLGYLHDLGVDTLWLTPIVANSDSAYHGYHAVDFYAVDPHMGTLQDYQQLVAEAHRRGMKVVMDFVANHVGPTHPWVKDPPAPDWFHGTPQNHMQATYNFSGLIDPHASARQYRSVIEGWFVNLLPDLNTDEPKVEEYLVDNALWWTEISGLDGLRLDTFPYSSLRSWSLWHQQLRQVFPRLTTIGEVSDRDPAITAFFQGGRKQWDGVDSGVTTVFDFPQYYALRDVLLGGQPVQRLIDVLRLDWLYPRPEVLVPFIGNHDQKRFMGEAGASPQKLMAAFTLLLTMRGIPQIYSGDEIGMPGGDDPDNRRDFPGGFPGDSRNAFTAAGRTREEQAIFSQVQNLLRLRQAHPALREGKMWNIGWDESYWAFMRETAEERVLVVFNNTANARQLNIPLGDTPLEGARTVQPLMGAAAAKIQDGAVQVTVPAATVLIYAVK
ncbi:MAG: alpha-amylase family glycosyl hydrolase [Chlamydiota bacterium]